jgi:hypothetical protein
MSTDLIPEGTYRARGVSAQLGFTSTGKEQVAIGFTILTPGFEGQHLPYYGTFGEKALEITTKALRACGWQGLDLSDLTGIDANEVNLVVAHEEYNGVTTAKVKWVNDGTAGLMKNVMADTEKRAFAARMRGAIAGLGAGAPAPKAAAPRPAAPTAHRPAPRPPEPPPHTDEDMPF